VPIPNPPTNLAAVSNNPSNIDVSWKGGIGADYYLVYQGLTNVFGASQVMAGNAPSKLFANIPGVASTTYYIWVVGVNSLGSASVGPVSVTVQSAIVANYTNPTGIANLMRSFNKWIESSVPAIGPGPSFTRDFTYFFTPQIKPPTFPCVIVGQFQYFDKGSAAWGNEVYPRATSGLQTQGRLAQTMMDISIYTDVASDGSALLKLWKIRDRITAALERAGVSDDVSNSQLVQQITLYDYFQSTPADTGIIAWVPVNEDNHIIHRYYVPTEETPNIHRYQLLVKLCWWEMIN
jgi:hypothetical protein